jgi:hypothetical protein
MASARRQQADRDEERAPHLSMIRRTINIELRRQAWRGTTEAKSFG